MNIRLASLNDLEQILTIVRQAQKWLEENNINQWQNGYPNKETIEKDLDAGYCHVAEADGKIIATVSLVVEPDINYSEILTENGLQKTNIYRFTELLLKNHAKIPVPPLK